jgi:uncharacterized membrane protein YphA (DoxX/SURF4 family)
MKYIKEHVLGIPAIAALILGVLCPLCFVAPLLIAAGLGSALGFAVPLFKPLLVLSLIITFVAFSISFSLHKNLLPLILAILGGCFIYYGGYIRFEQNVIYLGGLLLLSSVGSDWWLRKKSKKCKVCKAKNG